MRNIKVDDKIVFDNGNTLHYILVKKISVNPFPKGRKRKMINNKYYFISPFRKPTTKELENKQFK